MAVESRICPIGFAGGTIPQIPANILLVKTMRRDRLQLRLLHGLGRPQRAEREGHGFVGQAPGHRWLAAQARADPPASAPRTSLRATIAGTFDLADWVQGFKLIEERTVVGKAVLVP